MYLNLKQNMEIFQILIYVFNTYGLTTSFKHNNQKLWLMYNKLMFKTNR